MIIIHILKKMLTKGLIFATDLGGNVYYYGKGREGLGLYIVGAGMEILAMMKQLNLQVHLKSFY